MNVLKRICYFGIGMGVFVFSINAYAENLIPNDCNTSNHCVSAAQATITGPYANDYPGAYYFTCDDYTKQTNFPANLQGGNANTVFDYGQGYKLLHGYCQAGPYNTRFEAIKAVCTNNTTKSDDRCFIRYSNS